MTWTYTDEYYRDYTRVTWNESAEVYTQNLRVLEPFRADLLKGVVPAPGERVLDIATGPGEPAMTIANAVGPKGSVVGIDLSEKMIEIAGRVARARKLDNVEFKVMDAEKLQFPDSSFDLAVSAFGLQIVTGPENVGREAFRVVRRGGRIGVSVWSTGERVPAIHVIVGPMLEHAEPDESGYLPTPYEMGGPGEMVAFLERAGFHDARETRVKHAWSFQSADAYVDFVLRGTPIGHSLGEEDIAVQDMVLRKARENLKPWTMRDGSVSLPAECVLVTAQKR